MYTEAVFKKNAVMIVARDIEKYTDLILDVFLCQLPTIK
jgi:hypothetical protein